MVPQKRERTNERTNGDEPRLQVPRLVAWMVACHPNWTE